jgi:hypothetical protein
MEDSRVPRRIAEHRASVEEEIDWLAGLDMSVWEALAGVCCEHSGQVLRADTMQAAHISMAFVDQKVFRECSKHPWSLATGDQEENLKTLAAGPEPEEPTAWKIWKLCRLGFPRAQVLEGLQPLLDCPWGTASVERQHASATLVLGRHPDYGSETLLLRSLAHSLRLLVPGQSQTERRLARQRLVLEKMGRQRPQGISGRQIYVKDLMGVAKEWKETGRRSMKADYQTVIMRAHGRKWADLSDQTKKVYDRNGAAVPPARAG